MLRYGIAAPRPSRFPSENDGELPATTTEAGSKASHFLWLGAQNSCDDVGHAVPVFGFRKQLALPCRGEPVIFGFAVVFRFAPLTGNPSLMFEAIERGIERALLDFSGALFQDLLDAQKNAVAVQRAERDGFEDEHVERALQKTELCVHEGIFTSMS